MDDLGLEGGRSTIGIGGTPGGVCGERMREGGEEGGEEEEEEKARGEEEGEGGR